MGGAVVTQFSSENIVGGLVLLDIVEGSAIEALPHMGSKGGTWAERGEQLQDLREPGGIDKPENCHDVATHMADVVCMIMSKSGSK